MVPCFFLSQTQNESGDVLSLHFTARESNCTAGGDSNWQECDYLQDPSKVLTVSQNTSCNMASSDYFYSCPLVFQLLRHCRARLLLKETNEILSHYCSGGLIDQAISFYLQTVVPLGGTADIPAIISLSHSYKITNINNSALNVCLKELTHS